MTSNGIDFLNANIGFRALPPQYFRASQWILKRERARGRDEANRRERRGMAERMW